VKACFLQAQEGKVTTTCRAVSFFGCQDLFAALDRRRRVTARELQQIRF
jgi:hypothetical protein